MKIEYTKANIIRGILIYSAGDTIAALMLGEFLLSRLVGIALISATIYAVEIPNYFRWIDYKTRDGQFLSLKRTGLALLYFNPLWIARHLLFIKLFSFYWSEVNWGLLKIGLYSYLVNIPLSFLANYFIQNKVPLKWRFTASAIFSAFMAVYYALSAVLFK